MDLNCFHSFVGAAVYCARNLRLVIISTLTACLGAGGGIMMLGGVAKILPPQLIVPLHGIVQLGSNAGRMTLSWRSIDWRVILSFLPGAITGAVLGSFGTAVAGLITTFLSLFIGASGPLVGAFIKQIHKNHLVTVATLSTAMVMQHIFKLFVFNYTGIDYRPWLLLLALMISAGALGTWVGLKLMSRMSDQHFDRIFNWVLTLMALRLIWQALSSM